jgi:hypothetical protein
MAPRTLEFSSTTVVVLGEAERRRLAAHVARFAGGVHARPPDLPEPRFYSIAQGRATSLTAREVRLLHAFFPGALTALSLTATPFDE